MFETGSSVSSPTLPPFPKTLAPRETRSRTCKESVSSPVYVACSVVFADFAFVSSLSHLRRRFHVCVVAVPSTSASSPSRPLPRRGVRLCVVAVPSTSVYSPSRLCRRESGPRRSPPPLCSKSSKLSCLAAASILRHSLGWLLQRVQTKPSAPLLMTWDPEESLGTSGP